MGQSCRKLAVVALMSLLATVGNGRAAGPIRLGVAGPLSGDLASYGMPSLRAVRLVVQDVNVSGGVLHRPIEILEQDDHCSAELAEQAARSLTAQRVHGVVGHICTSATKAALDIYREAGIVAISPAATNPVLTESGKFPNFFRTIAPDDVQAKLALHLVRARLKLRKVAVVHDGQDYGRTLAEQVKRLLDRDRGLELVLYEGLPSGAQRYAALVEKIRRSGAQAVIFGGHHPEAAGLVTQMRQKHVRAVFVSDDGVTDEAFLKTAGAYAEGAYVTGPTDAAVNPMAVQAIEAYREAYGSEPGAFFLNAWSAALSLLHAIGQAGSTDLERVSGVLKTQSVETPLGSLRFDEHGDAIGVGFVLYRVQRGVFAELK
jgi:branched-chain amino acid transport system substrate-binding protein